MKNEHIIASRHDYVYVRVSTCTAVNY